MQVPQINGEGDVWAGLITSGRLPERFKASDRTAALAFINRGPAKFLQWLYTYFPNAKTISGSRQISTYELHEPNRVFNVKVASSSSDTHSSFSLINADAAMLQENDILFVQGLYCYVQGVTAYGGQVSDDNATVYGARRLDWDTGVSPTGVAYSTTYGESGGNWFVNYEQLRVKSKGTPNTTTGYTVVNVERCYNGSGWADKGGSLVPRSLVNTALASATSTTGQITTDMKILRGRPAWPEGTNAPKGWGKNPIVDWNYTQEDKYAIEITEESKIHKTILNKDPLEIAKLMKSRLVAIDKERQYLFGRKGKAMDEEGKEIYTSGGAFEFIKQDTDHYLTYRQSNITYPGLLDMGTSVFNVGGSMQRDWHCGITIYNEFKKSFYSSGYMRYSPEDSRNFDMPVETLNICGGIVRLFPSFTMEECGYGTKVLSIDPESHPFVPVVNEGWDMKVQRDIQENGAQVYKEQWISISGLERRAQEYQQVIDFSGGI